MTAWALPRPAAHDTVLARARAALDRPRAWPDPPPERPPGEPPDVAPIAGLLCRALTEPPTPARLRRLLARLDVPVEPITGRLRTALAGADRARSRLLGRWLAQAGPTDGPVRAGLVLLGLAGDGRDRELLQLLGTLDELTRAAAEALRHSQPDGHRAVFELVRRVDGGGRVTAAPLLAGTTDPAITDWLLRTGYRNGVVCDELTFTAATVGRLHPALGRAEIDDELLDRCGDILVRLCHVSGSGADVHHYPDGPRALARYLALATTRPPRLTTVDQALRLADYAGSAEADGLDWPPGARESIRAAQRAAVVRPDWTSTVDSAIDGADRSGVTTAVRLAPRFGIDVHDRVAARLRAEPGWWRLWWALGRAESVPAAVALAEDVLPLAEIAAGSAPPDVTTVLRLLVVQLRGHPGAGHRLLAAATRLDPSSNDLRRTLAGRGRVRRPARPGRDPGRWPG